MRRDAVIVIVLLALVTALSMVNGYRESRRADFAPLRRESTEPLGANALKQWLLALDVNVSTVRMAEFDVPEDVGLVLLLQPSQAVTERDVERLTSWVEQGGTLLVAGSNSAAAFVMQSFGFEQEFYFEAEAQQIAPASLAMQQVVDWNSAEIDPRATLTTDRSDFVTHIAVDTQPVVVSFQLGEGSVLLSTLWEPFSNSGLQRMGNPELVLNLITLHPFDGSVWFDEYHHGERALLASGDIVGPGQWVRRTRLGQALLYSIALGYVVALWRGRRFGRPVPLPNTVERRAPLEYITAIANMNRRAGNRQAIVDDYRVRLKRQLGARHRIDPSLPDDDYLRQLRLARPELDIDAVQVLLKRLNQRNLSETELIALATDVAGYLKP